MDDWQRRIQEPRALFQMKNNEFCEVLEGGSSVHPIPFPIPSQSQAYSKRIREEKEWAGGRKSQSEAHLFVFVFASFLPSQRREKRVVPKVTMR